MVCLAEFNLLDRFGQPFAKPAKLQLFNSSRGLKIIVGKGIHSKDNQLASLLFPSPVSVASLNLNPTPPCE